MTLFRRLMIAAAVLFAATTQAQINAQINAIVSANSAAEFAAGANHFHQQHPDIAISARTPEQLAELSYAELRAWLEEHEHHLVWNELRGEYSIVAELGSQA